MNIIAYFFNIYIFTWDPNKFAMLGKVNPVSTMPAQLTKVQTTIAAGRGP